ncbi:MAG: hypothetical protein GF364_05720 [Candidatus Lokiarchaeota archaeon]|nr:hypothetical protein [Candidatus Lokiarchaeota archaeon]
MKDSQGHDVLDSNGIPLLERVEAPNGQDYDFLAEYLYEVLKDMIN